MKCIAKYTGKLAVEGVAREHEIAMDMPSPLSGDKGMTPGEMLLNSIAGCKIISFVSVANRNKIKFDDIVVEITGEVEKTGEVEGTHMPKKDIVSMHTTYKIKTDAVKSDIEKCLKQVDELCTVGKALSDKIKKTSEVIILD